DILYIKNTENALSQYYVNARRQLNTDRLLRSWKKYQPLEGKISSSDLRYKNAKADCLIVCQDVKEYKETAQLIKESIKDFDRLLVLKKSDKNNTFNTKKMIELLSASPSEHIFLIESGMITTEPISLQKAIQIMEKSFA